MSGLVKSWLGVIDDYAAMMHRTRGRVLADHALGLLAIVVLFIDTALLLATLP